MEGNINKIVVRPAFDIWLKTVVASQRPEAGLALADMKRQISSVELTKMGMIDQKER